ncbi:MAG: AarF/ABC1/UbiB kinase family protein, partial [Endomicrobium sp.]|nr:AarF/ABC1/UbiB kinase family protein [Endomicrobium sp.]
MDAVADNFLKMDIRKTADYYKKANIVYALLVSNYNVSQNPQLAEYIFEGNLSDDAQKLAQQISKNIAEDETLSLETKKTKLRTLYERAKNPFIMGFYFKMLKQYDMPVVNEILDFLKNEPEEITEAKKFKSENPDNMFKNEYQRENDNFFKIFIDDLDAAEVETLMAGLKDTSNGFSKLFFTPVSVRYFFLKYGELEKIYNSRVVRDKNLNDMQMPKIGIIKRIIAKILRRNIYTAVLEQVQEVNSVMNELFVSKKDVDEIVGQIEKMNIHIDEDEYFELLKYSDAAYFLRFTSLLYAAGKLDHFKGQLFANLLERHDNFHVNVKWRNKKNQILPYKIASMFSVDSRFGKISSVLDIKKAEGNKEEISFARIEKIEFKSLFRIFLGKVFGYKHMFLDTEDKSNLAYLKWTDDLAQNSLNLSKTELDNVLNTLHSKKSDRLSAIFNPDRSMSQKQIVSNAKDKIVLLRFCNMLGISADVKEYELEFLVNGHPTGYLYKEYSLPGGIIRMKDIPFVDENKAKEIIEFFKDYQEYMTDIQKTMYQRLIYEILKSNGKHLAFFNDFRSNINLIDELYHGFSIVKDKYIQEACSNFDITSEDSRYIENKLSKNSHNDSSDETNKMFAEVETINAILKGFNAYEKSQLLLWLMDMDSNKTEKPSKIKFYEIFSQKDIQEPLFNMFVLMNKEERTALIVELLQMNDGVLAYRDDKKFSEILSKMSISKDKNDAASIIKMLDSYKVKISYLKNILFRKKDKYLQKEHENIFGKAKPGVSLSKNEIALSGKILKLAQYLFAGKAERMFMRLDMFGFDKIESEDKDIFRRFLEKELFMDRFADAAIGGRFGKDSKTVKELLKIKLKLHSPTRQVQLISDIVNSGFDMAAEDELDETEKKGRLIVAMASASGPLIVKLMQILSNQKQFEKMKKGGKRINEIVSTVKDENDPLYKTVIFEVLKQEGLSEDIESLGNKLGSASIAQVHDAKSKIHGEIVVKVARPSAFSHMDEDFRVFDELVEYFQRTNPDIGIPSAEQLRKMIREELDFNSEIDAMQTFAENMQKRNSRIRVPKVFSQKKPKGTRVIMMEKMEGDSLDRVMKEKSANESAEFHRDILREFFEQIFIDGFYHADLHGGNILIDNDGNINFIDLGAYGKVKDNQKGLLKDIFLSILSRDFEALKIAMCKYDESFTEKFKDEKFSSEIKKAIGKRSPVNVFNLLNSDRRFNDFFLAVNRHKGINDDLLMFFQALSKIGKYFDYLGSNDKKLEMIEYIKNLNTVENDEKSQVKAILPENQEKVNNMIIEGKSPLRIATFVAVKEFFQSLNPKKFTLAHAQDGQTFKEAVKDNPAPLIVSLSAWLAIAALSILNPFALPLILVAPVSIAIGSIFNIVIHTIIDYVHITVFLKPVSVNKKEIPVKVPDEIIEDDSKELTDEEKKKLADYRDTKKEIINEIYGENPYPELEKEIKEIFERLLDAMVKMGKIKEQDKKEYELVFYDTSEFNAYAIKTTKSVFFTSAVIVRLYKHFGGRLSKDHIAGILGHELQHTIQKNKKIKSSSSRQGDDKKKEYNSDLEALYIMDNAGFNPKALSEVMNYFAESNQRPYAAAVASLVDPHPTSKDRLEMINKSLNSKNTIFKNIALKQTSLENSNINDKDTLLKTMVKNIKTNKELEKAFEEHKNIYDILLLLPKERYESIQLEEFIKKQIIDKTYFDYTIQEREIMFELLYGAFFNDVTDNKIKSLTYQTSGTFFWDIISERSDKIKKLINNLDVDSQRKLKNWIVDCKILMPVYVCDDEDKNNNWNWFWDMSVVYLQAFSYISQKLNYQDFEKDYNKLSRRYDVIENISKPLARKLLIWMRKNYKEIDSFIKNHFNGFSKDFQKKILSTMKARLNGAGSHVLEHSFYLHINFDSYISILEIINKAGYPHEISLDYNTIKNLEEVVERIADGDLENVVEKIAGADADKIFHCLKQFYANAACSEDLLRYLYEGSSGEYYKFSEFVVKNLKDSKKTIKEIFEAGIFPLLDGKYFFEAYQNDISMLTTNEIEEILSILEKYKKAEIHNKSKEFTDIIDFNLLRFIEILFDKNTNIGNDSERIYQLITIIDEKLGFNNNTKDFDNDRLKRTIKDKLINEDFPYEKLLRFSKYLTPNEDDRIEIPNSESVYVSDEDISRAPIDILSLFKKIGKRNRYTQLMFKWYVSHEKEEIMFNWGRYIEVKTWDGGIRGINVKEDLDKILGHFHSDDELRSREIENLAVLYLHNALGIEAVKKSLDFSVNFTKSSGKPKEDTTYVWYEINEAISNADINPGQINDILKNYALIKKYLNQSQQLKFGRIIYELMKKNNNLSSFSSVEENIEIVDFLFNGFSPLKDEYINEIFDKYDITEDMYNILISRTMSQSLDDTSSNTNKNVKRMDLLKNFLVVSSKKDKSEILLWLLNDNAELPDIFREERLSYYRGKDEYVLNFQDLKEDFRMLSNSERGEVVSMILGGNKGLFTDINKVYKSINGKLMDIDFLQYYNHRVNRLFERKYMPAILEDFDNDISADSLKEQVISFYEVFLISQSKNISEKKKHISDRDKILADIDKANKKTAKNALSKVLKEYAESTDGQIKKKAISNYLAKNEKQILSNKLYLFFDLLPMVSDKKRMFYEYIKSLCLCFNEHSSGNFKDAIKEVEYFYDALVFPAYDRNTESSYFFNSLLAEKEEILQLIHTVSQQDKQGYGDSMEKY